MGRRVAKPVTFASAFAALSLLFSLLSWGQGTIRQVSFPPPEVSLALHMLTHALLGGLVALPSGRPQYVVAGALAAVLIDVDHLGSIAGLPMVTRTAHSFGFMAVSAIGMYALTRWSKLNIGMS